MKTFLFSIAASLILIVSAQSQLKRSSAAPKTPEIQKIYIEFGRASRQCSGFGVCKFSIDITIGELISVINAFRSADGLSVQMTSEFFIRNRARFQDNALVLEEDFKLDAKTANALGFDAFVLKKGKYPVAMDAKTNTYNCTFRM